ncbi:arginine--tRNA ligase [bacterium NHP-B]|nr:arginine--tRNA ligase [bacterium NHP-B]
MTPRHVILDALSALGRETCDFDLASDHPLRSLARTDLSLAEVTCELPPKGTEGDIATNVAFILSRRLSLSPRDTAHLLVPVLSASPYVEEVSVAGPGFLNLTLKEGFWADTVRAILSQEKTFGHGVWGAGQSVNVEYVSANPTGPLHMAHGRVAVVGDVLANLFEASGFDVTREYYINDRGVQVDKLARSLYMRYCEVCGVSCETVLEGAYPGAYLIDIAQDLYARDGRTWLDKDESAWLSPFKAFAMSALMAMIRHTMDVVGIKHDVFVSEQDLFDRGLFDEVKASLDAHQLTAIDTLPPPKGKKAEGWTAEPLLLFKATKLGETQDAPLCKSDGSPTYLGGDLAYHTDKLSRQFDLLINVWGADHASQVGRLKAAVDVLSEGKADLSFVLCQIVHVLQGGKPVKMSKRAGSYVELEDIVQDVGADVLRFMMVSREHTTHLTLDIDVVKETSSNNPVFYVHYAYARGHSVLKEAQKIWGHDVTHTSRLKKARLDLLCTKGEQDLIKKMAFWPACVEGSTRAREPHRITTFLTDVATRFHSLWSQGNQQTTLRFLREDDPDVSLARLALVQAMLYVLASGFAILGITPKETLTW